MYDGRGESVEGGDAFIETRYESQQSRFTVPLTVELFPTAICIEWNGGLITVVE